MLYSFGHQHAYLYPVGARSYHPDQLAALQRTTLLPFKAGMHKQCAVKVIDHRGNSLGQC